MLKTNKLPPPHIHQNEASDASESNAQKYLRRKFGDFPVQWLPLGEVTKYEQPTKYIVKTSDYNDDYNIPVLTAGKTFILGYTNETNGIYRASENNVIIFDDFTTANKWVDFDFKVKSSAMKIITSVDESLVLLKYIYYWINTLYIEVSFSDHKRQWISNYTKRLIPIPPMEVQNEVVEILDKFTALLAELKAELKARKLQYEYYRDQLLSFPDDDPNVQWLPLGEVCEIFTGGEPPKDTIKGDSKDEQHPYPVWANGKEVYGYSSTYRIDKDAAVISSIGANAGLVYFREAYFTPIIRLKVVIPKNSDCLLSKYLYYCLSTMSFTVKSGGIANINANDVKKIFIPIPPMEEQERIVGILDKFDTLTNSLTEGIPKEIEMRQMQYEYYRDALLSF